MLWCIRGGIYIKLIILIALFSIIPFITIEEKQVIENIAYVGNEILIFEEKIIETPKGPYTGIVPASNEIEVIKSYRGPMTAYGPDCVGCSGITSSGYNVLKGNIYYYDKTYGNIRIVAADKSLPFGTIVRISDLDVFDDDILAIVLDRGVVGTNLDLLVDNVDKAYGIGKRYISYDILRFGWSRSNSWFF